MVALELILLSYFVYVASYTFFFSVAALFYRSPKLKGSYSGHFKFCVLIPAYKEDEVIFDTAYKSLVQTYPADFFRIVVIADGLRPATVSRLSNLPIEVIEVAFEKSTKVKALAKALEQLHDFDYGVVLDADNIMAPDFLEKMNGLLQQKQLKAIQGQRKPKNAGNSLALLDGVSEAINNHIYRQGPAALHMSSSISGSGIVIDFLLLKENIMTMHSVGGFDRELELRLLKRDEKVYYYKDAVVWDEKVSSTSAFQNQRRRWISSQYFYLKKYFWAGLAALLRGDLTYFNSAILRNIQLPRLINLGLLALLTVLLFPLRQSLSISYAWWLALLLTLIASMLIAIPKAQYTLTLAKSIFEIPKVFVLMVSILFKLKGANKTFIHTPHLNHVPNESK